MNTYTETQKLQDRKEMVADILTSRGCLSVCGVIHDDAMWSTLAEWAEGEAPVATAQALFREVGITENAISDEDLVATLTLLFHEEWAK
jgi:hypothetical protein